MLKWQAWILILTLSWNAYSKTVLVSDIDDTIKRTNVNNQAAKVSSIFRTHSRFTGMSEIYQALDVKFYYVSGAIKTLLEKRHKEFLNKGSFPEGQLILRKNGSTKEFKVQEIEKIIASEKPSQLILVGDNGEQDPQVFSEIRNKYPDLEIHSFVHLVFDPAQKPVESNQTPYAYAAELAYHFEQLGLLSLKDSDRLMTLVNRRVGWESEMVWVHLKQRSFPSWLNCKGHRFPFKGRTQIEMTSRIVSDYCR